MTILPIITNDIMKLTRESQEWDFANPPMDAVELSQNLAETMINAKGLGLAAIQVDIPYRVFVMRGGINEQDRLDIFCFFNPRIVMPSTEQVKLEEGCLSFPGLVVEVKRPRDIRFRFTLPNGETDTKLFTGMTARVIQHEMDHLDGILFYNRANKYKRNLALKQRDKYLKFQKSKKRELVS